MLKKQKKGRNSSNSNTEQESNDKIWRVKLGDFITVSVYDLVTWVGIALCVGLVLIYGFQKNWRGFWWSLVVLLFLILIMLGIRAKQHFTGSEPRVIPRANLFSKGAQTILREGNPEQVRISITNLGDLAANSFWLEGFTTVKTKEFIGPLLREGAVRHEYPDVIIPGGVVTTVLIGNRRWTREGVNGVINGKYLLFHFSEGEYTDEAGNTYPIAFCFKYEPGFPLMSTCDKCYWPKPKKA